MTKQTEALKLALEALEKWDARGRLRVITAVKEALAQPKPDRSGLTYYRNDKCEAVNALSPDCICWTPMQPAQPEQEPVALEEWLAKQHGDPEEIGFLQALGIAYIAGQDSNTTPPQRKPLTDEATDRCIEAADTRWADAFVPIQWARHFKNAIEAAHGIRGKP